MKYIYSFLFAWIIGLSAWAQSGEGYDPENPADPTVLYNLTMEAAPQRGGSVNRSQMSVSEGEEVYCNAYANTGYTFKQWMVGDSVVSLYSSFYFTMPAENVVLIAYFDFIGSEDSDYNPSNPDDPFIDGYFHHVTLYATPSTSGYFNSSHFMLREGEQTNIYAYPQNGYRFASWKKDGKIISTDNPMSILMGKEDLEYTATFVYAPYNPDEPGKNNFNQASGELIIDQFEPGNLNSAIYEALGENSRSQVTSIVIAGEMNSSDFGFAYNMENCALIDISRTTGYNEIPNWGFEYLSSLTKIVLPSSIEYINYGAFYGCNNLSEVVCYATVPPAVYNAFDYSLEGLVVRVPSIALSLYKESEYWKNYTILPLDEETHKLIVNLPSDATDGRYKNMTLELVNLSSRQELRYIITDRTSYEFANLISDTKYNLFVKNNAGNILGSIFEIEIIEEDVSVTFESLLQPQNIKISVVTPDNQDVTDATTITWLDAEKRYLNKGAVLNGIIEGSNIFYNIALPEYLAMQYIVPAETEYIVQKSNNIIVQLVAFEEVTISGSVKDSVSGCDIKNVTISVSQTLNGKHSKSTVVKTERNGNFSVKVYNSACNIIFAAKDYVSKSIDLKNFDNLDTLNNIVLQRITGLKIKTNITFQKCVEKGQHKIEEEYKDYLNISYRIFNKTKNEEISNFNVQYPYIVLLEEVDENDELTVTAYSRTNSFNEVTANVVTYHKKQAEVSLPIVELGKLSAKFNQSESIKVIGILYNADGNLLQKTLYNEQSLTFNNLADGEYTLVTMEQSDFFNSILNLSDLSNAGLTENVHFVKNNVTIESGKITSVTIENVPIFNDSEFYYTSDNTQFSANKQNLTVGNYVTLRAKVDFKEEYANDIYDVRLIFILPDGCDFVNNSIMTGKGLSGYTIDGNHISLSLANLNDVVRFCVIPTKEGIYLPNAFVQFYFNGTEILQPIGTANFKAESMKINVPKITSLKSVVINGVATADSEVLIYDNGVLVGSTHSMANGQWAAKIELYKPYSKTLHTIHAEIKTLDGQHFISESKNLEYDENYTELSKITMLYNGDKIVFDQIERKTSKNSYSYVPSVSDFTFIAEFSNTDTAQIKNLEFVILASDQTTKRIAGKYDAVKQYWFVKTQYNNSNKLPINVKVDYIGTQETPIYDDEVNIDFSNMFEDIINDMLLTYSKSNISLITNTETELYFSIVPDGYENNEYFKIIIEDYESLKATYNDSNCVHITNDSLDFAFNQTFTESYYTIHFWDNLTQEAFSLYYTGTDAHDEGQENTTHHKHKVHGVAGSMAEQYFKLPEVEFWYKIIEQNETNLKNLHQQILNLLFEKCEDGSYRIKDKVIFNECLTAINDWIFNYEKYAKNFKEILEKEQQHHKHSCITKGLLSVGLSAIGGKIPGFINMFSSHNALIHNMHGLSITKNEAFIPEVLLAIGDSFSKFTANTHNLHCKHKNPKHDISDWHIKENKKLHAEFLRLVEFIKSLSSTCDNNGGNGEIDDDEDDYPTPPVTPIIDPSGYVYEGVSSNRIEGVTATCFYKEFIEDIYGDVHENIVLWNAEEYAQENPLFTDENGMYRWDVPQGEWQVKFEKEGYETTHSEWLPVPPPQLEVNIAMIQNKAPEVKSVHAYKNGIEIEFDKYMQPATLTTQNIFVIQNDVNVEGSIELLNEEVAYEGLEETYASKVRFTFNSPITAQEITLTVSNKVKSYADKQMHETYVQIFDIEQEITSISADSAIAISYGEAYNALVRIQPAEAAVGKTLIAKSISPMIASLVTDTIVINEKGEAIITVIGELPGTSIINYSIVGYTHTSSTIVNVNYTDSLQTAAPIANIKSGSAIDLGTEITLHCATQGATIYYTLDGSCPCDDTDSRKVYDGTPIIITEPVTIKAMATTVEYGNSEVAEFIYTIKEVIVNTPNVTHDNQIQIYPIPTKNSLNIVVENNSIHNVTIYALNGMVVKSINVNETNTFIDVNNIDNGVYIINIVTDNGAYKRKFIKID